LFIFLIQLFNLKKVEAILRKGNFIELKISYILEPEDLTNPNTLEVEVSCSFAPAFSGKHLMQ
jgi:hypothetical protein